LLSIPPPLPPSVSRVCESDRQTDIEVKKENKRTSPLTPKTWARDGLFQECEVLALPLFVSVNLPSTLNAGESDSRSRGW